MLKSFKRIPACIALGVILSVCLLQWLRLGFFERIEAVTYDMRLRQALRFPRPAATNLGFVYIDEESVRRIHDGSLGYRFGLYWPRQVYAGLVGELADQGARAVALDIIFGELRPDHPSVEMADGRFVESDEFFGAELKRAGNVILAVTSAVIPPPLFVTNAAALGDISTDKDPDGILRRAKAFRVYREWHPAFRQVEADPGYGIDLRRARVEAGKIILPRDRGGGISVPLDTDGRFDLADFGGDQLPAGVERKALPFVEKRVWHMGVVLAAAELALDLDHPDIDLARGRIVLHGKGGVERAIPVDAEGYFYIDWSLPANDPRLTRRSIQDVLREHQLRLKGQTNGLGRAWDQKLVVVGSAAVLGNDLTDRGATPLESDTLLVSKHWNVANSILTGEFVRRAPLRVELALIIALGLAAAFMSWEFRALTGFALVITMAVAYVVAAFVLYIKLRYWIPLALPVLGALLTMHLCLLTWRVVFEQREQRRIRSVFSTIVSPKIVHEVLQAASLSLGGARREITVLFADIRGFTEFTDASREQVAELIRQRRLGPDAAEACYDQQARETLETVNTYLGLVADTVIRHDGTLDKYIGDCVMAFWGAPASQPRHALACVRAAVEAQRAIFELNRRRSQENEKREAENLRRLAVGLDSQPLLPVLSLGTGINTGMATVGLMGSEAKTRNYTVFGREVNLASRLEALSGHGRILISEATRQHLVRDDPALAASCIQIEPVMAKGIRSAIVVYEVPWRLPDPALEVPLAG